MDKKCEELLADSVINNRYPNKAKLIIRYLYFFSTVINTPVENFIKTFVEKCGKVWRTKKTLTKKLVSQCSGRGPRSLDLRIMNPTLKGTTIIWFHQIFSEKFSKKVCFFFFLPKSQPIYTYYIYKKSEKERISNFFV